MRVLISALLLTNLLSAQDTEIFLFDLSEVGDQFTLSNPRYLSAFDSNITIAEPSFADTYQLLVSSIDKGGQRDIIQLNIFDNSIRQITKTADQEYSPKHSPNKQHIACVVYDSLQGNHMIWQYPSDLSSGGNALAKLPQNLREFCFLDKEWLALYEASSPSSLHLFHPKTGKKQYVSNHVGQCLKKGPEGETIFIHKHADDYWFLKRILPGSRSEIIKKTIPGVDRFTVLADGSIVMAKGSRIYHLDVKGDNLWKEIANLELFGIDNVSDLAFNGINMLALVVEN
ncbi:MAG: hypothetical protein HKN87_17170 [Saprospiraceae bacterium]|nr:hypothetical protein [Saprospiraceae bacterium]